MNAIVCRSRNEPPVRTVRRWWILLFCALSLNVPGVRAEDGVALGIIYDTSGSMRETVRDSSGNQSPKYIVANRAMTAIIDRLQNFTTNTDTGDVRKIQTGLYAFRDGKARAAIEFGEFNPGALRAWVRAFQSPNGATPLGQTIQMAGREVLKSPMVRKHLLVVTDGVNTSGPDPARVLPVLLREAGGKGASLAVHFVAFDVAAKVFDPVKKLGATVVGAVDEKQLRSQLEFILEKKILLEEEEPQRQPAKAGEAR